MSGREPVYVVKLRGQVRSDHILNVQRRLEERIGGKVIAIDDTVEYVAQLEPADAGELVQLVYDFARDKLLGSEDE